jgi:serine/threonine protein kinase
MAVKRLFSREQKDFQKEFHMLSRLTLLNHPHLVKLLASYKLKDKYHFLFPYANANLRSHWDSIGMPYWNPETCLWTLSQMSGLTSGLEAIHNFRTPPTLTLGSETGNNALTRFRPVRGRLTVLQDEEMFGRHGDLKPENILWSNELEEAGIAGILQIADLGLGRFHRLESRSQVDPKTVNGSPTYTPPEISLEIPVSRAYDIWSLGCVFLEFITWLLEGSAGIYKFSEARSAVAFDGFNDDLFFTLVSPELGRQYAVVRDGVTSWIRYLHQSRRCSPAINDLLKLIQDHMIVVDSRSRIPAKKLDQEIKQIFETAKANPEYLLGKNPSTLDTGLGIKMPKVAAVQSTDDSDIPSIQIQGP